MFFCSVLNIEQVLRLSGKGLRYSRFLLTRQSKALDALLAIRVMATIRIVE